MSIVFTLVSYYKHVATLIVSSVITRVIVTHKKSWKMPKGVIRIRKSNDRQYTGQIRPREARFIMIHRTLCKNSSWEWTLVSQNCNKFLVI
jgi:hypothetical protein